VEHHKDFARVPVLLKNDGSTAYEIERDVGEADAVARQRSVQAEQRRRMISDDAPTRGVARYGTDRQRSRASFIVLWLTQIALAAMFLMAGGSKLAGVPAMVSLFDALGLGQWFRYVTGGVEVTSGIALLVPSAAIYGAMLLIPTMLCAIVINLFIVPASPLAPLVLLLAAAAVAWPRRHQLLMS
jgi:putative oxidoreductase